MRLRYRPMNTPKDPDLISRWNGPAFLAEQKRICDALASLVNHK